MNLLAIESATDAVGVALARDGAGTAVVLHEGGRAHAELLVPSIEEVCRDAGLSVAHLDVVAVDAGPGLFTGLRVGVATAKALGQALSIGVVPVSSLDVLAAGAFERIAGEQVAAVVAVVDARRAEVFVAVYHLDGPIGLEAAKAGAAKAGAAKAGAASELLDPASVRDDEAHPIAPELLAERLRALSRRGRVLAVGDGAVRYRDLLVAEPDVDLTLASELRVPPPAMLARLAADRLASGARPESPEAVRPDYRRDADARINWEERSPRPRLEGLGAADRRPA
jgi:tRNA threonylcarbamoyladenosine biosynthesis protein TsaB